MIDGVPSKSQKLFDGKPWGLYVAQLAEEAIALFPSDISAKEAMIRINMAIHPGYRDIPYEESAPQDYIVLATDGYPRLYPSPAESEAYLKSVLEEDPLCIHSNRQTKGLLEGNLSFDDRAYISFSV